MPKLSSLEICAGAGGQALGLERAGFSHECLVEIERKACDTILRNRPEWSVQCGDVREFSGKLFRGIDLLSGGVPCPPFSLAGKQLGADDERDLFPEAMRLVRETNPRGVILENVRGFLDKGFREYRESLRLEFEKLGYVCDWRLLNASDYGVSQLRPRVVIVALRPEVAPHFAWPAPQAEPPPSVGELLYDLMGERGWFQVDAWKQQAQSIAPTLVGGSKKHGGPDLGPTRARKAWAALGVDGRGLVEVAPEPNFQGMPRLTPRMTARVQGFDDSWAFEGKKTPVYRQIGNAFPPPVAEAVGRKVLEALTARSTNMIAV